MHQIRTCTSARQLFRELPRSIGFLDGVNSERLASDMSAVTRVMMILQRDGALPRALPAPRPGKWSASWSAPLSPASTGCWAASASLVICPPSHELLLSWNCNSLFIFLVRCLRWMWLCAVMAISFLYILIAVCLWLFCNVSWRCYDLDCTRYKYICSSFLFNTTGTFKNVFIAVFIPR